MKKTTNKPTGHMKPRDDTGWQEAGEQPRYAKYVAMQLVFGLMAATPIIAVHFTNPTSCLLWMDMDIDWTSGYYVVRITSAVWVDIRWDMDTMMFQ